MNVRSAILPAVCGALVAIALTLALRTLAGTKLLAEIVLDATTQWLQPRGFYTLISYLQGTGKPLMFSSVVLGEVVLFVSAWLLAGKLRPRDLAGRILLAILLSLSALLLLSLGLVLLSESSLGADTTWTQYALITAAACLAFALVAALFSPGEAAVSADAPADASRRRVLLQVPALALVVASGGFIAQRLKAAGGGGVKSAHRGQPTPEVTANDDFYVVSKNLLDPGITASRWRLRIGGASRRMAELTYEDVLAMPSFSQYTTFECISNEVGGDLMSNALWTGVALRDVIARVEPLSQATHVLFRSEDDYEESLPLDMATKEGVMLAHTMNGEPLPEKHGFPLRLVAPGRYGMKNPKWITEIVLLDKDMLGYWGKRDWTPWAPIKTTARIDVPGSYDAVGLPLRLHGVAFAGDRGISKVEVSTDNGVTWEDAVVKPALGPYTWVLWYYDWDRLRGPEPRTLAVRASDGKGDPQISSYEYPYPSGASGYHRVPVRVKADL